MVWDKEKRRKSWREFYHKNKEKILENGIQIKGFDRDLIIQDSKVGTQSAGTLLGKIAKVI